MYGNPGSKGPLRQFQAALKIDIRETGVLSTGENMGRILTACGNDCSACPRYTVHPYEKTDEALHHTAKLWMRIDYRDHVVTNEEIACTGCRPENHCRYHVVKCCKGKGIKTCAECDGYPCMRMKECFMITKSFEPLCRKVCTDEEYRQLKRAFFEKEENLSRMQRISFMRTKE